MLLLDSDTIIHYLKGHPAVVQRFQSTPRSQLAIPTIVTYELEYGTRKAINSRRARIMSELLLEIRQMPFDGVAAIEAASIRIQLEAQGASIGQMDLLIAATAMSRSAILVTNNKREFSRVKGLTLEDWTA